MKLRRYVLGLLSMLLLFMCFTGMAQESIINRVELTGQIAYIGDDHNVYTVELSENKTSQLTTDATPRARYEFPTWSKEGQLAYFCCSVRGSESPRLSVYISSNGIAEANSYYENTGERHVYAFWSPVRCVDSDCVDLAVLVQSFSDPQLRVDLFNSQDNNSQRNLGQGTPFYFSWSPSGETIVMHRNNSSLQYYSIDSADTSQAFNESLGSFLSPSWSPIDDRILFASESENNQTQLSLIDDTETIALSDAIPGLLSFSWSPDGQYIAYRYLTQESVSPVYVINANSGELISQSNVSGIIAFFWSPDSQKIAYITLSNPPGTFDLKNQSIGTMTYLMQTIDGLAWNVLDITNNSNTLLDSFIPTTEMQYLLTNFDQFAQSHNLWSPDSQYLVYSEVTDIDTPDPTITLLNVSNPELENIHIADGVFAVWSHK